MLCRRGGIVQPAQRDEAGEELGVQHLVRRDLAVVGAQRIGALGVAVAQQPARQQVALGPERRRVRPAARPAARASPRLPQRQGVGGAVGAPQPARVVQHHAGIVAHVGRQRGQQRLGVRRIVLEGEPRLGRRPVRRVEPRDLPRGGGRVVPGQVLEARPLVVRSQCAGPAAQEVPVRRR